VCRGRVTVGARGVNSAVVMADRDTVGIHKAVESVRMARQAAVVRHGRPFATVVVHQAQLHVKELTIAEREAISGAGGDMAGRAVHTRMRRFLSGGDQRRVSWHESQPGNATALYAPRTVKTITGMVIASTIMFRRVRDDMRGFSASRCKSDPSGVPMERRVFAAQQDSIRYASTASAYAK